jgi:hypothetical protein
MANDVTERKDTGVPKNDAYTGMLVISLLALILGSVLLFLDYSQYQGTPTAFTVPPAPKVAEKAPEVGQKQGEPNPNPNPMPEQKAPKQ